MPEPCPSQCRDGYSAAGLASGECAGLLASRAAWRQGVSAAELEDLEQMVVARRQVGIGYIELPLGREHCVISLADDDQWLRVHAIARVYLLILLLAFMQRCRPWPTSVAHPPRRPLPSAARPAAARAAVRWSVRYAGRGRDMFCSCPAATSAAAPSALPSCRSACAPPAVPRWQAR